jgi:4-amino-4-deoxy-L-arabinose transferase-like glycosyltransferase
MALGRRDGHLCGGAGYILFVMLSLWTLSRVRSSARSAMPKNAWAQSVASYAKQCWPEALLAVVVLAAFFGCLGSVELWGKREQRAAAEAIDTVENGHWLVAEIQGRPRLEKPPLPRWSIAVLMKLIGRRDEWMVRLPGAVAGALTIALIYMLGLRARDRELALAASFVLCSTAFFVGEMRQASNDAPLALFTTLALYAAWCTLEPRGEPTRPNCWGTVFYAALGLGFLTKGPIILLLVAVTLLPYLTFHRRLSWGLRRLASTRGILILVVVALCWPVAVLLQDPRAAQVWALEMSEKTGLSQILEHRRHPLLVGQWPGMLLPWTLIAALAVVLPFYVARRERDRHSPGMFVSGLRPSAFLWFAWWWGVGNMAVFCFWSVPKPNYYVPCLPGMALLIGAAWVELARTGRETARRGAAILARALLQTQWVVFFVAAILAPIVVRGRLAQEGWPWCLAISVAISVAVALSARSWRRGATSIALAPLAAGCVIGFMVAYGRIAPLENPERGHRALAEKLGEIVPAGSRTVMFFNEIDEGLWFYARDFRLTPVPRSQPRYNTAFDLAHSYLTERHHSETLSDVEARRLAREKQALFDWLDRGDPGTRYLVIRGHLYDLFARDLGRRVTPLLRETRVKRNDLILLEVNPSESSLAASTALEPPARR